MNYLPRVFVLFCLSVSVFGCGAFQSSSPVAVVDYGKIMEETGYATKFKEATDARERELRNMLMSVDRQFTARLGRKKSQFSKKPTDAEIKDYQQAQRSISNEFTAFQKNIGESQSRYLEAIKRKFQSEVLQPSLEKAAKEGGYSLVFAKNPNLLTINDEIDITKEIVVDIKENSPFKKDFLDFPAIGLPSFPPSFNPANYRGTTSSVGGTPPVLNNFAPVAKKTEPEPKPSKKEEPKKTTPTKEVTPPKKEEATKKVEPKKATTQEATPKKVEPKKEEVKKTTAPKEDATPKKEK